MGLEKPSNLEAWEDVTCSKRKVTMNMSRLVMKDIVLALITVGRGYFKTGIKCKSGWIGKSKVH